MEKVEYEEDSKRTFPYSVHWRVAYATVAVTSSCPYEVETTFGGAMIPHDSLSVLATPHQHLLSL